ncbi:diuretic hormone receptor isoform X1 [Solenopsis invicta]|uniref:diuretic hormone receptor isoform X1 n=1 Tax=Solenopsis invicta TaxID=13686 RepID=UPI00193E9ED8|nr:diuretic hormone receptor isoform X1 [Solenopsis invicta]XP_025992419.2 diuretic hormone receptor isoform X1 [Solenopsis invicta]XP_025992420.2 diuretic hormone receptor isoform X1 [Solenopsis invicta]XP_025992421.2 diuretic hormone receptor isoform X1 [Solenopsis invicta]XP_025992422.2 diuretic hormone receptor isoform X1 [Solenopsis invicta]XP_025992424.2 diuretic hormone receptor isoform X1 [Solenopsis invicta]XP_025992425.2 diuretic hormone receptor isoform X1 [Solenopsis invicta]XP_0
MAWYPANGTKPQVGDNYVLNVLNYINELNESFSAEHLKCLEREHQDQENQKQEQQECEVNWDTVLCWPRTLSGTLATIPCFDELNGIPYDSTQNASRWCMPNGTWDSYSNYSMCLDVRLPTTEPGIEIMTTLYFIGYSISLFTLIMAVCIFIYYKELRCLRNNIHRNNIHTNLMFTYILADLTWILTTIMQVSMQTDIPTCVTLFSLLHYFHLTNFFWMFVEGLYLYLLVVKTFTGDNIKLRLCLVIGWGIPVLVIVMWGIAKSLNQKVTHHVMNQANQEVALWKHCPWMTPHPYDWFYQASALTVLAVNMIFLFMIMRVLITKLWSSNNVETQQYRKASKALLVLIPLLGVTYVLVIAGPTKGQVANAFYYARAVLLSSQGFFVALFYCFLNTEVQNTVRHHFARWSTARNLGTRRRYYNNWSPRSRTESIRLCQPSNPYRKRESTVSETTTTTVIGLNSTTTFLDKSKRVISEELNE